MPSNLDPLNTYVLFSMCLIDFNNIKMAEGLQMKFLTQEGTQYLFLWKIAEFPCKVPQMIPSGIKIFLG